MGVDIGFVSGFLTVVDKSDLRAKNRSIIWKCECTCGKIVLVQTQTLNRQEKKSCGCKTKAETSGTHGMHGTPTYRTWRSMIERCTKEYHHRYDRYKDKEIDLKWMTFEGFFEDMGLRPDGMTLDRIDNTQGYYKDNCRWATDSQQQQNKLPNYINKNKGLAGVFYSNGKYCSRIRYNGQREYLGTFNTPEEANDAYNKRGFKIFGEIS